MPEIEIWTTSGCQRSEEAKTALQKAGFSFVERSLKALRCGDILDVDALVEFAMRDGNAPLIRVDGKFISDVEFEAMLLGTE